jgi:hypothetical protein
MARGERRRDKDGDHFDGGATMKTTMRTVLLALTLASPAAAERGEGHHSGWFRTPEIDPALARGAAVVLAVGLIALRGRKRGR